MQHHLSLYIGYGKTGEERKKLLVAEAKKRDMNPNRFLWHCFSKVTGINLVAPTTSLTLRPYKK